MEYHLKVSFLSKPTWIYKSLVPSLRYSKIHHCSFTMTINNVVTTAGLGVMLLGRIFVGMAMGFPIMLLEVRFHPAFVHDICGSFTQIATCLGLIAYFFIRNPTKDATHRCGE